MPDSLYDPTRYDSAHSVWSIQQARNGGRKRAATARRDCYGRMLPKDETITLCQPAKHGRAGGLARISKAQRDSKGRFIKIKF